MAHLGECCLCTQAIKGVQLQPHYTWTFGHKAPLANDQNSLVVPTLGAPVFIDLATLTGKKDTLRSQNKRGQFNSGTVVFPPTFCSVNYRNSQSDAIRVAEGDGSAVKMSGQMQNKLPQNKLIYAPGEMTTERNGSGSFLKMHQILMKGSCLVWGYTVKIWTSLVWHGKVWKTTCRFFFFYCSN